MILILIFSLIAFTIIVLVFSLVIRPYLLIHFYRKQGIDMYFKPGKGFFSREESDAETHNDFLHYTRQVLSQNPSVRGWGGNAASKVFLHIIDPALIKIITQNQMKYYIKDPTIFGLFSLLGGEEGLIFAEGDQWKKHRRIISSAFHHEFLKDMVPTMYEAAKEQLEVMGNRGETVAIEDFEMITGSVVGRVFFGNNFKDHIIDGVPFPIYLKENAIITMKLNLSLPVLIFGPKIVLKGILPSHRMLLKRVTKFFSLVKTFIETRRCEIKKMIQTNKKSLLDLLILNSLEDPKEGLTDKEITEEFLTFSFAGMDTTGQLVTMTSYHLHQNPDVLEKVRKEADLYIQPNMTAEALNKMEYTHAVLQESLRMTGPGSRILYRQSMEDHNLGDLEIKKGTVICTDNMPNYYSPLFHDEPFKFNPDRWLDPNSKTRKSLAEDPYVYVPFSAGQRNCIGQHLAIMEAKMILGQFVKKFDFKMRDGYKLKIIRRFMFEPEERIWFKLKPKI